MRRGEFLVKEDAMHLRDSLRETKFFDKQMCKIIIGDTILTPNNAGKCLTKPALPIKPRQYALLALLITFVFSSSPLIAANKIALVIGNSDYSLADYLPNPVKDSKAIADKLRNLGFEVIERHDLTLEEMNAALHETHKKIGKGTIALFYYAGHGIQKDGQNYLIPVDADISKAYEIEYSGLNLRKVLDGMSEAQPSLNIALLDACRNNPYEKRIRGLSRTADEQGAGLAAIDNARGSILSYATEPGNVAIDGTGEHSPYAVALLKHLEQPGLSIQDMLAQVGLDVMIATQGEQRPWYSSSPAPRFCFAGCELNAQNTNPFDEDTLLLKQSIETGDVANIERLVTLSTEQKSLLNNIFRDYSNLVLDNIHKKPVNGAPGIQMEIREATNIKGNRIRPSNHWSQLSFILREP
jgi:hypothetical protein